MAAAEQDVKELRKLWGGFWSSRVLLTANNLGVFDRLRTPKTADALARTTGTDKRALEILLDALTGLGLLRKAAGYYLNSSMASRFLVQGSPYYQGDIIRHADALWKRWSDLDAVIKTGGPSRRSRDHRSFIKSMHNIAAFKAPGVIGALALKGVRKALDLGGGPGTYSMEMARRKIDVTLFDLPDTIKIAKGIIKESGVSTVGFHSGDILKDPLTGRYDLIFMSQFLHAFSAKDCARIISKCKKALTPGGIIAIHEFFIDRNRTAPPQAALFSVNMLVNTPGGRCYPPAEMKQWLKQLGFKGIKETMLEDTVLVSGRKPK